MSSLNYINRNETNLPSSLVSSNLNNFTNNIFANNTKLIIGTTGTPLSYVKQLINSTDGTAQTEYRGTGGATGIITMGLAHTYGDAFLQLQYASINQPLQFQNLTGGNIVLGTSGSGGYKSITMHGTGSLLLPYNLTISGTLQSFQTSLLSTSSSVIDGKVGV